MSNSKNLSKQTPPESVVSHLFGFVLGLISGMNSIRRLNGGSGKTILEDPPEGVSMAYSKLDTLAGDALLHADARWFLFEMKRDYVSISSELNKPKIANLAYWIRKGLSTSEIKALISKAIFAHRFLYISLSNTAENQSGFELATLSYPLWLNKTLNAEDLNSFEALIPHKLSFIEWLAEMRKKGNGFSKDELVLYVRLLNTSEDGVVSADAEDVEDRLAVAIDQSGVLTAVSAARIRELLQEYEVEHAAGAEGLDNSEGLKKSQGPSFGI